MITAIMFNGRHLGFRTFANVALGYIQTLLLTFIALSIPPKHGFNR